jgi:hypothetical protein
MIDIIVRKYALIEKIMQIEDHNALRDLEKFYEAKIVNNTTTEKIFKQITRPASNATNKKKKPQKMTREIMDKFADKLDIQEPIEELLEMLKDDKPKKKMGREYVRPLANEMNITESIEELLETKLPFGPTIDIEAIKRKQNYKGVNRAKLDEIIRTINITEPIEELLDMLKDDKPKKKMGREYVRQLAKKMNITESIEELLETKLPFGPTIDIEAIKRKQNYKPIDRKEIDRLIDEMNITEPIEDLLEMLKK